MTHFSVENQKRRQNNRKALSAFGIDPDCSDANVQTISEGKGPAIFTIGYERRDGEDLLACLIDNGVGTLVDVRQRAMSRKADFRGKALAARCDVAGIKYIAMPGLGSTDELRDQLRESGDFKKFTRRFKSLAKRKMSEPLDTLASLARKSTIAMICYERCHHECHRSILADELHERLDASIIAIK